MSNFADFNVGTLKLNHLGETTQLTGSQVNTSSHTATWNELIATVHDIAEIADVVVSKEDTHNKSLSILTDETSDTKYPTVKAVKTYVDSRSAEQSQFVNSTLQALQNLQAGLSNTVQVDTTKEDLANKSTNLVTDAASDTKYPSVKAVKTYVDTRSKSTSLVVVEGESTLAGQIQWTCGSCPMEGLYGLLLPSSGKVKRITGIAYGTLSNLDSIEVTVKAYALNSTSNLDPVVLRTIPFQKHPTMSMLYAQQVTETTLPASSEGVMLLLEESFAKDNSASAIPLPPYVRFRLTLEYESVL